MGRGELLRAPGTYTGTRGARMQTSEEKECEVVDGE